MHIISDFGIATTLIEDAGEAIGQKVATPVTNSGGSFLASIGKAIAPVADDIAAPLIGKGKKKTYTVPTPQPNIAQTNNILNNPNA